jgi:O-antigen/teichoic acid export membrane protein
MGPAPSSAATSGVGARSTWILVDQGVNSAQTFLVGLAVAREVSLGGVGAFAVAVAAYQVLIAVTHPLHADPLAILYNATEERGSARAAEAAGAAALLFGATAAALVAVAGLVTGGVLSSVLLAFAVAVPAVCLQDLWRTHFVSSARPLVALANDSAVLAALVAGIVVSAQVRPHSAAALTLAWAAALWVGAVLGAVQAHVRPRLAGARRWWTETITFSRPMVGEYLLTTVAYVTALLGVALAARHGLDRLGELRTAQVALSPLNPLAIALTTLVLAEGGRSLHAGTDRLQRLVRIAAVAAGACSIVATVAWLAAPIDLGTDLIGPNWERSRDFLLPWGACLLAIAFAVSASAGLRALRRPDEALRGRLVSTACDVVGVTIGAVVWGPIGAVAGIAAGETVGAVLMMRRFETAWRSWREPVEGGARSLGADPLPPVSPFG